MYAYCLNNPVNYVDVTGTVPWWIVPIILVFLTGCSEQEELDVGSAPEYISFDPVLTYTSVEQVRRENPNCYTYAIGIYSCSYDPGELSGYLYSPNVESVAVCVLMDMQKLGRGMRRLEGPNSPIKDNEYRIALRVSDYDPSRDVIWDYHFMVQTSDGRWAEKHGPGGATVIHDSGTPDTISWDCGNHIGFYSSEIIYFAVTTSD